MAASDDLLPLFPLPNVVLFPGIDLPLHIFEPRYRAMVGDALAGRRVIGMALLRGDWRSSYYETPEIYALGCAGRIEKFSPQPDGRSNLVLHGTQRFRILEEVSGAPYRQARVEWLTDEPSDLAESAEARLRASLARMLRNPSGAPEIDDLWSQLPAEASRRINTLSFALDLSMIERQALLECDGVTPRADRLAEILEFRLAERAAGGAAGGDEPRH